MTSSLKLFWILYYIKQIDSKLPCVCSVIDYQWHTWLRLVCHFFVLTTFWHHLWSITEQTHGILESICDRACWRHFCSLWKLSVFWKLKVILEEFNGFFIIKQIEKPWLCSVLSWRTWEAAKALKKRGEALDFVSCFPLHFFRALASSCVLYNRTDHSQSFSIC